MLESGRRVFHQMSELVQRPAESSVAFYRICLSKNNSACSEGFSLITHYLVVVAFIRYQQLRDTDFFDEYSRFNAVFM